MKTFTLLIVSILASFASAFAPLPLSTKTTTTTTSSSSSSTSFASSSSSQLNAADASIQFVRGLDEKVVPDVKLTRAKDGSSGVATFQFVNPNVFDASTQIQGEVTGMFMVDEEGELSTTDVNARFANGKPQAIESTYVMKTPADWDRFMRFMERYGEANGLGFTKA